MSGEIDPDYEQTIFYGDVGIQPSDNPNNGVGNLEVYESIQVNKLDTLRVGMPIQIKANTTFDKKASFKDTLSVDGVISTPPITGFDIGSTDQGSLVFVHSDGTVKPFNPLNDTGDLYTKTPTGYTLSRGQPGQVLQVNENDSTVAWTTTGVQLGSIYSSIDDKTRYLELYNCNSVVLSTNSTPIQFKKARRVDRNYVVTVPGFAIQVLSSGKYVVEYSMTVHTKSTTLCTVQLGLYLDGTLLQNTTVIKSFTGHTVLGSCTFVNATATSVITVQAQSSSSQCTLVDANVCILFATPQTSSRYFSATLSSTSITTSYTPLALTVTAAASTLSLPNTTTIACTSSNVYAVTCKVDTTNSQEIQGGVQLSENGGPFSFLYSFENAGYDTLTYTTFVTLLPTDTLRIAYKSTTGTNVITGGYIQLVALQNLTSYLYAAGQVVSSKEVYKYLEFNTSMSSVDALLVGSMYVKTTIEGTYNVTTTCKVTTNNGTQDALLQLVLLRTNETPVPVEGFSLPTTTSTTTTLVKSVLIYLKPGDALAIRCHGNVTVSAVLGIFRWDPVVEPLPISVAVQSIAAMHTFDEKTVVVVASEYTTRLSLTTPDLLAGLYKVWYQVLWKPTVAHKTIYLRVVVDDIVLDTLVASPYDPSALFLYSGFNVSTLTSGIHTVAIQAKTSPGVGITLVEPRLEINRVTLASTTVPIAGQPYYSFSKLVKKQHIVSIEMFTTVFKWTINVSNNDYKFSSCFKWNLSLGGPIVQIQVVIGDVDLFVYESKVADVSALKVVDFFTFTTLASGTYDFIIKVKTNIPATILVQDIYVDAITA